MLPGPTGYGRTIYVDGNTIGDVWCYGISSDEPKAMVTVFSRKHTGVRVSRRTESNPRIFRKITDFKDIGHNLEI